MSCEPCERDKNQFDPGCLRCGRRYLRDVKRTPGLSQEQRVAWLRTVLETWKRYGHLEDALRTKWGELDGDRRY